MSISFFKTKLLNTPIALVVFWILPFFGNTQSVFSGSFSKSDTLKINSILQKAKELYYEDPEESLRLSKKAGEMSDVVGYVEGKAYALKHVGMVFYLKNRTSDVFVFWNESLNLFEEIGHNAGMANMLSNLGALMLSIGSEERALDFSLKALQLAERIGDTLRLVTVLMNLGSLYHTKHDKLAIDYYLKLEPLLEKPSYNAEYSIVAGSLGEIYLEKKNFRKAIEYYEKSILNNDDSVASPSMAFNGLGKVYFEKGEYKPAIEYFNKAISIGRKFSDSVQISRSLQGLGKAYIKNGNPSKGIMVINEAFNFVPKDSAYLVEKRDVYRNLAEAYAKNGDLSNELKFLKLFNGLNEYTLKVELDGARNENKSEIEISHIIDSLSQLKSRKITNLQIEKINKTSRVKTFFFVGGMFLLGFVAFFLYQNNRKKQRINLLLEQQRLQVEDSLTNLKATQAQLIQSEKMASLGELTAGIAHEIQNPLNFVNNFSEVSNELIGELVDEVNKGNTEEVKIIAKDVQQNLEKILHHGKRADAIVKGMLQHSRASSGEKVPTNINALADEYLRLAYHGMRAKDNTFKAELKTNFDEGIANINIVPQDLGRVFLNLVNNAFFATGERSKKGETGYIPAVSIRTKKEGSMVLISVKDNGSGIPEHIKGKIFQPFFTTKPTGEGTGLGLSLSYDIVKAQGGDLRVESNEGQGSEFVILLPIE